MKSFGLADRTEITFSRWSGRRKTKPRHPSKSLEGNAVVLNGCLWFPAFHDLSERFGCDGA